MTYDINMIKDFYASYAQKVNMIRSKVGRPLTYAERCFSRMQVPTWTIMIIVAAQIMRPFSLTECACKMPRHRWPYFNS